MMKYFDIKTIANASEDDLSFFSNSKYLNKLKKLMQKLV